MNFKIHFHKSLSKNCWEVFAYQNADGFRIPYTIQIIQHNDKFLSHGMMMNSSCELDHDTFMPFIRAMKDGLAEAGLLESSSACEAELKATKYHLEDMRKLTFKAVKL